MANTLRELAKLAVVVESTWGVAPSGSAEEVPVNAGEWLNEVVDEFRDDMPRGVFARDFHTTPTVRHSEGTITGVVTPVSPFYFFDSIMGGTELKGNLRNVAMSDTNLDIHEFVIGQTPRSLSVQQSDGIVDEIHLGMMASSYTLRFNSGEGGVEWEAELLGKARIFPATAKTTTESTMIAAANSPPKPIVGSMAAVDINGNTAAKVLDFEIVFARDIELLYGAANTAVPNIRRSNAPRVTFTATVELQAESDIQKYANDAGNAASAQATNITFNESTATFFDSNLDTWHVRIATDRDIDTTNTPIPTTSFSDGANVDGTIGDEFGTGTSSDRFLLDIYLDRVSYAESPIIVDRSEQSATFQFNGVALYDTGDSRIGIFRVINAKTTKYTGVDV